jgi:periplasmic mercuric ion binding protein
MKFCLNAKLAVVASFAVALLGAPLASADVSVKLSDVHLCCGACVKGVDKALAPVGGASAKSDRESETVTITAPDKATAQKAVDALVTAGYFGKSSDAGIKVNASTGATAAKVTSLNVSGVHLCCNKCVTVVKEALSKVPGVKASTAKKDAPTFQVTGDFKPTDVFSALHDVGLTGKAKAE